MRVSEFALVTAFLLSLSAQAAPFGRTPRAADAKGSGEWTAPELSRSALSDPESVVDYSANPRAWHIRGLTLNQHPSLALWERPFRTVGDDTPMPDVGGSESADPASAALSSGEPSQFVDLDGDGIDDNLEQLLANKFAPVIFMELDESNYPVNVEWFLKRAHLQYHEDCWSDRDDNIGLNPLGTQENLIGAPPWVGHAHCGENDTGWSHPPHRDISTIARDPDGQWSAGPLTTGYSDQQTFVLPDLADAYHVGSLDPNFWKTYFHAYPTNDGGIMLQYWHLFAYNELSIAGFGRHGGDWDATIHVQLDSNLHVKQVWFSRHANDKPGDHFLASNVSFAGGTHTLMTIDGGGHAAYRSPQDFCNYIQGQLLTNAAWPNPQIGQNLPDASSLFKIVCMPPLGFVGFDSARRGGTVWQTWEGGTVTSYGSLTHPITSPSGHGGMVNLGEYNPCMANFGADPLCWGSRQASMLLNGQFRPLNGQIFIQYSGRWGSLPHGNVPLQGMPPRGPVFQGWEPLIEGWVGIYTSWYNQGANWLATPDGTSWRKPPTTARTITGPTYSNGGITYVSGTTTVGFTVTQEPVAASYGAARSYYRVYRVGGTPGTFVQATGGFSLAPPDGTYQIDYYSMDALNNQEATRSFQLTGDTTRPMVTIRQPTGVNYPLTGTITLDYSVSDGTGTGVANVTATLDGKTTIGGHGLASGESINVQADLTLGPHTLTVTATDRVGNSAVASVGFVVVAGCTAPSISAQPQSQTIASGATTTLTVAASGTGPLSYQWYLLGNFAFPLGFPVGTDASSFTTPALTATTRYWVRVLNACGHADSTTATVSVDSTSVVLIGGRYKVTSHWKNQYAGGQVSTLSATKLTDATAAFWVSDSSSFEYLIRISTATNNGRAWIAIPMFTDVEFWITVTDLQSGQHYEYHSSAGNRTLIYDPSFFVYPFRAEDPPSEASRTLDSGGFSAATATAAAAGWPCVEDARTMCLVGGRYKVTSYWQNQYAGGAISTLNQTRLTDATGAFWVSDNSSFEYLIRISTATNNGRAWIAIPTFTDVEFWITVQDIVNSQSYTYHSPAGNRTLIYDPGFFMYP